jgi:chloramphenicol O-acetyltransferase type A
MQKVDIQNWERKEQFLFFKNLDIPQYQIATTLDVTNFRRYVKKEQQSFYLSFIHGLLTVMNRHTCFKYRFFDDDVVLYEQINPSFTQAIESSEQFKIVTCQHHENLNDFIEYAEKTSFLQGHKFIDMKEEVRRDLVYITTVPWYSFTQVTHAHNIDRLDAIPKICFGKYKVKDDKLEMPFAIEVHHAFVDGYHLGVFFEDLQKYLDSL